MSTKFTTLEDLEAIAKPVLTVAQVAEYLGMSAQSIRMQAQRDAAALGFPCICVLNEVRIPRDGFCYFMRYGRTDLQKRSST